MEPTPTNPRLTELIGEQELLDQVVLWDDLAYNPDQLDHTPQHPVPNLHPAPVQSDFNPQDFMTDEEIAEQFLILQQFSESRKRSREESHADELEHGSRKSQRVAHDTTPQSGEVQVLEADTVVDNIDATVEEMAHHGVPSALNLHNNANVVPLPNNNTDPSALPSVQDIRQ